VFFVKYEISFKYNSDKPLPSDGHVTFQKTYCVSILEAQKYISIFLNMSHKIILIFIFLNNSHKNTVIFIFLNKSHKNNFKIYFPK
jgi:hypothetical protein